MATTAVTVEIDKAGKCALLSYEQDKHTYSLLVDPVKLRDDLQKVIDEFENAVKK
ncbi:hypothetical protein [Burkholderia cepacia]|uniref:hypothetical protein n=1 Tax=Burkholderia cepacia TaxID=292 RepID=UPI000A8F2FFE|nr:hypothetical protein [Burkholderia cepacia]